MTWNTFRVQILARAPSSILLSLILPFIIVGTSAAPSYAIDPPNFKIHIENSVSSTENSLFIYSADAGVKKSLKFDSSGNIAEILPKGSYSMVVFPNQDESSNRTSSNYKFTIASGVVTSFTRLNNYLNVKPDEVNATQNGDGYFQVYLGTTGFILDMQVGSETRAVGIESIYGVNKYNKPVNPTYLGNGKVVVDIDPGTYLIYGYDVNGNDRGTAQCVVTLNSISSCSIVLNSQNFSYVILSSGGSAISPSNEISTRFDRIEKSQIVESREISNLVVASTALQDGLFNIRVFKSRMDMKTGQSTNFQATVMSGEITELKSLDSNETIAAEAGVFPLKLKSENFNMRLTANDIAFTDFYFYSANKTTGSSWSYPDSAGLVSTSLPEGLNYVQFPPTSSNIDYVSSQYQVMVESGIVTSVTGDNKETISATAGIYSIPLKVTNVKGTFTIGGSAASGYVGSIYEKSIKQWMPVYATSINSEGRFGINLPRGSYEIGIYPSFSNQNNGRLYMNCDVPDSGSATCNLSAPQRNLTFDIYNTSDTLVATNSFAFITPLSLGSGVMSSDYIYSNNNGRYSLALQNGQHSLIIRSNNQNLDGQDRKFTITISGGLVTKVIDEKTSSTLSETDSVYRLTLGTPNFKAVVKANDSPNPNAYINSRQEGFGDLGTNSDTDGKIGFDLPNGRNKIRIYTTGNESPTVVSAEYVVIVDSGTVSSVSNSIGETLTGSSSVYTLDYLIPNIVGTLTLDSSPVSGYVNGVWNTVLNRRVDFGGTQISSNGQYALLVPAGNYDVMFVPNGGVGGVQSCNATAGVRTSCDINFPANNFELKIKNFDGDVLTQGVDLGLTRTFSKGQSFPGQSYGFGLKGGGSGTYLTSLFDGIYQLSIQSNSPFKDGDSRRFSFKVESGTVGNLTDLDSGVEVDSETAKTGIRLVRPNFKAKVMANGAAVGWTYLYAYPISGNANFSKSFYSDSQGRVSLKLPDGEFKLYAYPSGNESPMVVRTWITLKIDSGTVASAISRDGTPLATSDDLYLLNFESPNVTGALTIAGASGNGSGIEIGQIFNEDTGNFPDYSWTYSGDSSFGMRIDAGNYLATFSKSGSGGSLQRCTASASATTCDFDLPADNFIFKIQSNAGESLLEDVGAVARLIIDRSRIGFWLQPRTGGVFNSNLKLPIGVLAHYEFSVYTTDGSNRHGIEKSYKVTIDGETIIAVTDSISGVAVTASPDGVYGLRLGSPNLAGTVTGSDASTPIPNANVSISGPIWTSLGTDDSGAFSTRLEQDGSYSIWARAPEFDITKGDSARTTVEISGGVGATNLQLSLRSPTVKGTVTGPTGISPYNYIQVLKKNTDGYFEYFGENVSPRSTNTQGKFAFYLDIGVYKFQTEADEDNAGGGRTISEECAITDTAVTNECNITLTSYNTKIRILGENNLPYTNANLHVNFAGRKDSTTLPDKTWDYGFTNIQGQTKLSLEDGTWNGRVDIYGSGNESPMDFSIEIESGVVKAILSDDGETFTAGSDGYFEIKLPVSNLRGTIFEATTRVDYGASVSIWQQGVEENGFYADRWINGGKFAFKATPGNYTIQVRPYPGKKLSKSSPVTTKRFDCEVPVSGTVDCDITLRGSNFNGKIVTPSGALFERSYAYIYKVNSENSDEKEFSWVEGANVMNGEFSSYLETGTYQVTVSPHWDALGTFTESRYEIISSGELIQSLRNMKSNETMTAINGKYLLALSSPSVSGRVLAAGSGGITVRWAQIVPINVSTSEELWEYASSSNSSGRFALSLPDGTYDIVARQWGHDGESKSYSSSPLYRVTVTSGVGNLDLDIRMRSPNVTMRVVNPTNASVGLADVWIHANFNGQYFGGSTNSEGFFTAFVDTSTTTTCSSTCRIYIYPGYQSTFTPRSETFTTVTSIGNLSPGVPNSVVTLYVPTNGGTGVPNKWSWFSVEELDSGNGVVDEQGYGTNELGRAGIGLTAGTKYRITAYPSGDFYGRYSPKIYLIDSFDATTHASISITFDSPNATFIVRDTGDVANAWGWYEIFTVSGEVSTRYVDGYLNEQGRGAQYLPDGIYRAIFYPGKSRGVEKTITFTVASGVVTNPVGGTFSSNNVGTVIMGAGNVTGTVRKSNGNLASNIAITATSTSGSMTKVSTVTKDDGTFELNLDTSQSWNIKAVDPVTEQKGTANVFADSDFYTDQNVTLGP